MVTDADREAHAHLQAYTLTRRDDEFLHQYVVDAWTAQTATTDTKPIALTFALMGLYLHCVHGWTGRQVQWGHMMLARRRPAWPSLHVPTTRGDIGPAAVLSAPEGPERDGAIRSWCGAVWAAYAPLNERAVDAWLRGNGLSCETPLRSARS